MSWGVPCHGFALHCCPLLPGGHGVNCSSQSRSPRRMGQYLGNHGEMRLSSLRLFYQIFWSHSKVLLLCLEGTEAHTQAAVVPQPSVIKLQGEGRQPALESYGHHAMCSAFTASGPACASEHRRLCSGSCDDRELSAIKSRAVVGVGGR